MKNCVNVNRSGLYLGNGNLPAVVTSVEIAEDKSAVVLDFDVFLMTSAPSGWKLLTFDEYLAGNVGSRVLALLCARDGAGHPLIESVRFVADVLGLSKSFISDHVSGIGMSTICMVPYLRPGQFGTYRSVHDAGVKWNVRTTPSINVNAGIIFRPSFDVCQIALSEAKSIYMEISTSEASLLRTCKDSPSSAPSKRSQIEPVTAEGGVLSMAGVTIQDDGVSLSPCSYPGGGQTVLLYLQMWSVVGLLIKSPQPLTTEPVWTGLRSDQDSRNLNTVLIPQSDIPAAAPTLPGEMAAAVFWEEIDVPVE